VKQRNTEKIVLVHFGDHVEKAAVIEEKAKMIRVSNFRPKRPWSVLHKRPTRGSFVFWLYRHQKDASDKVVWWEEVW
jgi:hypothetical protein